MPSLEAIGVRLETEYSGITDVVCRTASGAERMYSLADIISFINGGNEVYTQVGASRTPVLVVCGPIRGAYIRTVPNKSVADNLLSLPTY